MSLERRIRHSGRNRCRPEVEALEDRCVPSGFPLHRHITTTFFYIGEPATPANGFIANDQSAWDGHWVQQYGGVDDPTHRSGFFPAGFVPRANPF
jgi:hypothetical protein